MRRKGEKKYVHPPLYWSEQSTVAHCIRTRDRWLVAWIIQQGGDGLRKLAKGNAISQGRMNELWQGADPSDAELELLAPCLRTDAASLRASVAYERALGLTRPALPTASTDC